MCFVPHRGYLYSAGDETSKFALRSQNCAERSRSDRESLFVLTHLTTMAGGSNLGNIFPVFQLDPGPLSTFLPVLKRHMVSAGTSRRN